MEHRADDAFHEARGGKGFEAVVGDLHEQTLSAITDAVFLTDDEWKLVFICPNYQFIFDNPELQPAPGNSVEQLLHGLGLDRYDDAGDSVVNHIPFLHMNARGEQRQLAINLRRVMIGRATWLISCRDVTDLLQTSDLGRRLAEIVESSEDVIALCDAELNVEYLNSAGSRITGRTAGARTGPALSELHAQWARHQLETDSVASVRSSGRWSGQSALLAGDGGEVPVSQQLLAHYDEHGAISHISSICRDVRPLMRMHDAQRRRTQQQSAIAELGVKVAQGVEVDELLGLAVEVAAELLQAGLAVILQGDPADELNVVAASGQVADEILGGRPIEGGRSWTVWQALPLMAQYVSSLFVPISGRGQAYGTIGILATKERLFDSEDADFVQSLANTLSAAIIREADVMLAAERSELQRQLIQTQKLEALGTLAGGIAHDFNNILYAITGYSELVLDTLQEGSEAHEYQQQVLEAASRAADLVKQILSISRHSTDEVRPVRIAPVIREVVKLLRAAIPTSIELVASVEDHELTVLCNEAHLHQVVMNLGTNAAQAMLDGGKLSIGLRAVEIEDAGQRVVRLLPGRYALITVADTGPGIPTEIRERVFEPFFTTKPVGQGTGLGLSIVNGIVTRYGGAIRLESNPGQGSSFEVYLPVHLEGGPETDVPAAEIERGRGERILFVDDEVPIAALGESLNQLGYSVVSMTRPTEALELFRADPEAYAVLVTDQTMPGMSGYDLALACRRIRPDLPVILCTGFSQTLDAETARAAGFSHFLTKPVTRVQLARALREAIEGH